MTDAWLDRLRAATVAEVAPLLGFDVVRRSPGKLTYACPACGAERRHTKAGDKRGAVDVADGKPGAWFCRQCEQGGDAVDFVAFVELGRSARDLDGEGMRALERWTCGAFNLSPGDRRKWSPSQKRDPVRESLARAASAPRVELLPADEVATLWNLARPVSTDSEACAWLESRGIVPKRVELANLARVLPADVDGLPEWAGDVPGGGPYAGRWTSRAARGWRLLVPMFDTSGTMRSFRFRRFDQPSPNVPKSLGALATGCVFADVGALELLQRVATNPTRILVAEGETDFLRAATEATPRDRPELAFNDTLGIVAGSITPALGRRIPDGSSVIIATDDDAPGERYARELFDVLGYRVRLGALRVERWRPTPGSGVDIGDAGGLANGSLHDYLPTTSATGSNEATR